MKHSILAEKGITAVDKVDEGTAKVIQRWIPQQHKDTVYDMLLPLAKGTREADTVLIEGPTIPTWDK